MIDNCSILKPEPKGGYLSLFTKKRPPIKTLAITFIFIAPIYSHAIVQESAKSSIKKLTAYPSLEGGNVVVQLERNGYGCRSGYWISNNDPGFEATYTMLLDAFKSGKDTIVIEGDSLESWSTAIKDSYCHIDSVQYSR